MMIRIILMALVTGSVLGLATGTFIGGANFEGALMGITSIVILITISVIMFYYDKKHIVN